MTATVHRIHDDAFEVSGADLPLIPEGVYPVVYKSFATANMYGKPRVIVRFQVARGEHSGIVLESFYVVRSLIGKAGKNGKFSVTKRQAFIRDFVRATNHSPDRLDRIPMTRLRGQLIHARVRTVKRDKDGDPIPECLWYSRIGKLLEGEYMATS